MTAFNVLAFSLLQDDSTNDTSLILAQISHQLANLTISGGQIISASPAYTSPRRVHPTTANVIVNVLWFTSLALSLISASVAILVKQWLQEHTSSMPESAWSRIRVRHFRFQGFRRWRVSTIAKVLPLLLQISLLLFFVGLSVLLWTVSFLVSAVVTVPMIIWLIFWLMSILFPSVYPNCPYLSAESIIFFTIVQQIKSILCPLLRSLSTSISSPLRLKTLIDIWKDNIGRCYHTWILRENVILTSQPLTLENMVLSHAGPPDTRILANSIYFSVQYSNPDDVTEGLLHHLYECSSGEDLRTWVPSTSVNTISCIRASIDVLKNAQIPFEAPASTQSQDGLPPNFSRRQLLVDVLGNYLHTHNELVLGLGPVLQDLLDLPVYVDFRGLPMISLSQYMFSVWAAWSHGRVVQLPST